MYVFPLSPFAKIDDYSHSWQGNIEQKKQKDIDVAKFLYKHRMTLISVYNERFQGIETFKQLLNQITKDYDGEFVHAERMRTLQDSCSYYQMSRTYTYRELHNFNIMQTRKENETLWEKLKQDMPLFEREQLAFKKIESKRFRINRGRKKYKSHVCWHEQDVQDNIILKKLLNEPIKCAVHRNTELNVGVLAFEPWIDVFDKFQQLEIIDSIRNYIDLFFVSKTEFVDTWKKTANALLSLSNMIDNGQTLKYVKIAYYEPSFSVDIRYKINDEFKYMAV